MRLRVPTAFVVLALGLALWSRPVAATVEVKADYWPTTPTLTLSGSGGSNFGNWTTNFFGGDFRWTSGQSHWGIHLKYDAGSEGAWGGYALGVSQATGGTDTVWSGDVFYQWQSATITLRGFAGYGDLEFSQNYVFRGLPATGTGRSYGYRVGADAVFPISNTNFAFNASAAWYPSNTTSIAFTAPGFSSLTYGSGTAADLSASIQYTWAQGWLAEAGYRWINANITINTGGCPCTIQAGGPFFAAGYRW